MKYKLAIFDMDGTILNTLDDLADSLNYALSKNNFPKRSKKEIRSFVGNGAKLLVQRAVPDGTSSEQMDKVYSDDIAHYNDHCDEKTAPYDGIIELINNLKKYGCRVAVVSNKLDITVQNLCRKYFPDMFECVVGERQNVRKKPYPDSVFETLKKFKIDKEDAVYIGDTEVDIETAKNAQMDSIIVDWGFRDDRFLRENGADTIVSDPSDIMDIICESHCMEKSILK